MSQRDRQLLADLAALDRPPPAAAPQVVCEECAHFRPDQHNRVAGMGFCMRLNGWNYPAAKRYCRGFEERAA